ncbi:hypothetical protein JDV02_010406 [Purpureocillium takamizusanense]|uniref:Peptidase A1 domain-containing protein n=1 Tax=Purpureocillium takamizusanense TaxID=2060973 RepID=A0A9Q8QTR0_9HYPO|nr:uncharacterized protein JDV02_010406 [Purpureocillium takamizusanense]UNI24676.1 hypothetical protein JDV02_010406 [Purpureocillium takamizusanense]
MHVHMHSSILIAVVTLSLQALALPADSPTGLHVGQQPAGIVHLPLKANPLDLTGRFKRGFRFSTSTVNDLLYTVDVRVGTPGTSVKLAFSLTSPVTWVNPNCSGVERLQLRKLCRTSGRFYPEMSRTFDGTDRPGRDEMAMAADSMTLGSSVVQRQPIGLGGSNATQVALGTLGVAPEPHSSPDGDSVSIVENLQRQGVTGRSAVSLDIRGADTSDGGSVLFGGVDTHKFSGPLVGRKMTFDPFAQAGTADTKSSREALRDRASALQPPRFTISFDQVGVTARNGSHYPLSVTNAKSLSAGLDSSNTISYLPAPAVETIAETFFPSAQRQQSMTRDGSLYYTVDCDATTESTGSLDFTLGDITIRLPFKDLVGSEVNYRKCILGVAAPPPAAFGNQAILGANFLKQVYAVFDWQDHKVYLAQRSQDCGRSSSITTLDQSTSIGTLFGECGGERQELRRRLVV